MVVPQFKIKIMRVSVFLLAFVFILSSCATTSPDSKNKKSSKAGTDGYGKTSESGSSSSIENKDENQSLDVYLSRTAGVNVSGSGARAQITIRGVSSFSTNNEPLFILDGQPMSSYAQVYNLISPQMIQRVDVLKEASDTTIYGTRGNNGVILIYRKKAKK